MIVSGAYWGNFYNRPTNRITTAATNDGPTDYRIDYKNFRLSRNEWLNLPSSNTSQMKCHITDNPTDMNNDWAVNNYVIVSPRNNAENPILSQFGGRGRIPAAGKIYGKRWEVRATGGGGEGGWDEMSGNRGYTTIWSNNDYCTHWDFNLTGSPALFQVIPNRGGANNEMRMNAIDNSFGWFGETNQANHHFGKCGGTSADDYSFATKQCTGSTRVPHSFNGGEGRYLQWFVK
jgi:hypothetical protein